jgi:beta-mannosidase
MPPSLPAKKSLFIYSTWSLAMHSLPLYFLCFIPLNVLPFSVLAAASGQGPPLPPTHTSLSTFKWSLANANRSIVVPTPFLNQPHLALIEAGLIDDPNIGLNEGTTRWVGEEEAWTWETQFKVDTDGAWAKVERVSQPDDKHGSNHQLTSSIKFLKYFSQFYLVFNGLDTFCDIHVNGHRIGSTDNAFRSWVFDGKLRGFLS